MHICMHRYIYIHAYIFINMDRLNPKANTIIPGVNPRWRFERYVITLVPL